MHYKLEYIFFKPYRRDNSMKLFIKQGKNTLLLSLVLFTGITLQAMEQQGSEYGYLVDTLDAAMKSSNPTACKDLFESFSNDLNQKDPIERAAIVVGLTQEAAAKKNEQLTGVFCNALVSIYNTSPGITEAMQEIISPVIRPLAEHKQISALGKIHCIFSNNIESEEYRQIDEAIKNKLHGNTTVNTDEDEAIARLLQEEVQSPDDNFAPKDNDLNRALALSLQTGRQDDEQAELEKALRASRFTNPSAPVLTDIEEDDAVLRIALAESLQVNTPNTNSNPSIWNNLRNIFLDGFGS